MPHMYSKHVVVVTLTFDHQNIICLTLKNFHMFQIDRWTNNIKKEFLLLGWGIKCCTSIINQKILKFKDLKLRVKYNLDTRLHLVLFVSCG